MIFTLIAFVLPMGLLFFADIDTYLISCLYLYGLVLCYRYAKKEGSVLDIAFFITYLSLSLLQVGIGVQKYIPYTGTVIYFILTIIFIFSFLGLPLTTKAKHTWEPEILSERKVGSFILASANLISLILSIKLFPSVSYIIVPLIITMTSIPFSIFISSILINIIKSRYNRKSISNDDKLIFKKIFGNIQGLLMVSGSLYAKEVTNSNEREMFFQVIKQGYYKLFQKSTNPNKGNYTEFLEKMKEEYRAFARQSTSYIVYDTQSNVPVGSIRIVSGGPKHGGLLPMESFIPISLKRLGLVSNHLAEVGRIVIVPNGPKKAKVLELLIYLMIVKALLSGVRVLLTDAMESSISLYKKMGLKVIGGPYFDTEFSQNAWLCGADIAYMLEESSIGIWNRPKKSNQARKTIEKYLFKIKKRNRILHKRKKIFLAVGDSLSPLIDEETVT